VDGLGGQDEHLPARLDRAAGRLLAVALHSITHRDPPRQMGESEGWVTTRDQEDGTRGRRFVSELSAASACAVSVSARIMPLAP
jgi:hypothetical protein